MIATDNPPLEWWNDMRLLPGPARSDCSGDSLRRPRKTSRTTKTPVPNTVAPGTGYDEGPGQFSHSGDRE
jgi:hypothetical protein